MTTADIRQIEAGALAFGQKTYGDDFFASCPPVSLNSVLTKKGKTTNEGNTFGGI